MKRKTIKLGGKRWTKKRPSDQYVVSIRQHDYIRDSDGETVECDALLYRAATLVSFRELLKIVEHDVALFDSRHSDIYFESDACSVHSEYNDTYDHSLPDGQSSEYQMIANIIGTDRAMARLERYANRNKERARKRPPFRRQSSLEVVWSGNYDGLPSRKSKADLKLVG